MNHWHHWFHRYRNYWLHGDMHNLCHWNDWYRDDLLHRHMLLRGVSILARIPCAIAKQHKTKAIAVFIFLSNRKGHAIKKFVIAIKSLFVT